ncbi:MAG: anthranilate/para-aminobenzoate synthase component, partial [Microbacterium sp.]|nr:anthranilate/para-aminobenzoate synthase component [Microbacterium sp.]
MTGPDPSSLLPALLAGSAPFALIARDGATVEVLTGDV